MLIRLLRLVAEPSQRERQIDVVINSVTPESRAMRGWLGAILLTQPHSGVALSASLWASAEALEESEIGGHYRRQLDKFRGIWSLPPDREVMPVAVHHFKELAGAGAARVTTLPIRLGTERDVEKIYRDDVLPDLVSHPGFCATMLLPRPVKSIAISLYADRESLEATEGNGFYREQVGKMDPFLSGDAIKEHFDVNLLEVKTPARTQ